MKKIVLVFMYFYLMFLTVNSFAENACYRTCASWDTFCKSPQQIVATKCRLGVPVYHDECKQLGIPTHYMVRGGGDLVPGLPCSSGSSNPDENYFERKNNNKAAEQI